MGRRNNGEVEELRAALLAWALLGATAPIPAQNDLTKILDTHPFFTKVLCEIEQRDEFVFVLHQPSKADPKHNVKIINWFFPHLRELHDIFLQEYIQPLGLERTDGRDSFRIAVLNSKGAYADYAQAMKEALHWTRAHFNPGLDLAVTYEDSFNQDADPRERRAALLHELVHAMQHAYHQDNDAARREMPRPTWFSEGLAEYLSSSSNIARTLRNPRPRGHHLQRIASLVSKRSSAIYLATLAELAAAESYGDVVARVRREAGAAANDNLALEAFYAQSWAFTYFLHRAQNARYRQSFNRYMEALMRGTSHTEAFAAAFPDSPIAALDVEFRTWLAAMMRERGWRKAARAMERSAGAVANRAAATAESSDETDSREIKAFDYARLEWSPHHWQARLDRAIRMAERGDFERAAAAVERVIAPDTARPRIVEVHQSLLDIASLREVALRKAKDAHTRLVVFGKGRYVKRIEGDTVTLYFGSRTESTPLVAFRSAVMLDLAKREAQLFKGAPAVAFACLEILAARLDDAEARLGGSLETHPGLALIAERLAADPVPDWGLIADLSEPASPAEARAQLDTLVRLLRKHPGAPLLQERRADLMDLARFLSERGFDLSQVDQMLGAAVHDLANGRVRLIYDFDDPDQRRDLIEGHDDLEMVRAQQPRVRAEHVDIRDGHLEMRGAVSRRFGLPLRAPLEIRYSLKLGGPALFFLGFCADGLGHCIAADTGGGILLLDPEGQDSDHANDEKLFADKTYHFRVVHDGSAVCSQLEGQQVARIGGVGSRTAGHLFLWLHGKSTAYVDDLEIEGELDEAAARKLVRQRTDELLRSLLN
ncbi:MAG: hypothetical protein AAF628_15915 [Planctomycetota bacterium]